MTVAWQLGTLLALVGIIWQCFQMVFGTLEQRKFLVGTITKWFLFLFCMLFYPSISFGLKNFGIQMGTYVSGQATSTITQALGEYLKELEETLFTDKGELADAQKKLIEMQQKYEQTYNADNYFLSNKFASIYDYDSWTKEAYSEIVKQEKKVHSLEKRQKELAEQRASIDTDHPKGIARTINALRSVLIINGQDITQKYSLDLSMKNADGEDTGYLSPNAMLRISVLGAQVMWHKVWEEDVLVEWDENLNSTEKKGWWRKFVPDTKITDFPFQKIFDIILCFICMLIEVVISCIEMIQYVMCIIEFTICISFGIVLVPCLLFDGLKDMAMKLIPTMISQTVKLSMITTTMFFNCFTYLDITSTIITDSSGFNIWNFCYVVFTILLTFALCSNAPKLATAMLTGQPQMSMGEFVQSAGVIAGGASMIGKTAYKTAAMATEGAKSIVGGAARFTANRLGDAAAIAGGMAGGFIHGGGYDEKGNPIKGGVTGAIAGGLKAGFSRSGNRILGGIQSATMNWGKKGGGSGGGRGGSSSSAYGYNINGGGKIPNGSKSNHNMSYAGHTNIAGNQSTFVSYMKDTFADYAQMPPPPPKKEEENTAAANHPDSPGSTPVSGNNFTPPDIGGGGAMPPAAFGGPIFNMGSSVSFTPPMRDVTPQQKALPQSSLPSKPKRNLIAPNE